MNLTTAQKATIKADVLANFPNAPNTVDGSQPIADAYNAAASPTYWVYKSVVSVGEVGDAFDSTEVAGLTTADTSRLQTFAQYAPTGFNFSRQDRRKGFTIVFSGAGGAKTTANLDLLWRRAATVLEKLLATASAGNTGARGATTNPDTLGVGADGRYVEGSITASELQIIRSS
jgi:hypothetical protein